MGACVLGEARATGSWLGGAKNTGARGEVRQAATSRLKTPLSSRELNNNVHFNEGEKGEWSPTTERKDGVRARCVRIFKQITYANGNLNRERN